MTERIQTMSIIHHLDELRKRLISCIIAIVAGSIIGYFFVDDIRNILIRPADNIELIYITPPEALMANIRLAIMAGLFISMPVIIYHVLAFIIPALHKDERKMLLPVVFAMMLLFAVGITFAYMIALPFAITFFLKFATEGLLPMFTITKYLEFTNRLLFTFGLVFQLPVLLVILGAINVVSASLLRRTRKYVMMIIFIGAALITPPDIISQVLIAMPLIALYEISILLVWIIQLRKRHKYK